MNERDRRWYGGSEPTSQSVDDWAKQRTAEMISEIIQQDGCLRLGAYTLTPKVNPQTAANARWYGGKDGK